MLRATGVHFTKLLLEGSCESLMFVGIAFLGGFEGFLVCFSRYYVQEILTLDIMIFETMIPLSIVKTTLFGEQLSF